VGRHQIGEPGGVQVVEYPLLHGVDGQDSGGSSTAFVARVAAGAGTPPPHSHDGFDETVYGIDGVFTFTIDGVTQDLGPGQALCVRRGQVHKFENLGDVDASMLTVSTPRLFGEDYFLAVADNAAGDGPPDLVALLEVMARHGITPAAPV